MNLKVKELRKQIDQIWVDLKKKKYKTKSDLLLKLYQINFEIQEIRDDKGIFSRSTYYELFEVSQSLLAFHELMRLHPSDDLSIMSIILDYGVTEKVYLIFNKQAVRVWATNLDWFFQEYNKQKIVFENSEYALLESTLASNLGFTANIILDNNLELLGEKYLKEKTALEFYELVKKDFLIK